MPTRTTLRWNSLRCLQPNESSDEPYLWTYFWKLDGDTVRQSTASASMFSGSVVVHTQPGSHGNVPLGKHPYLIPPSLGQFATDLRPIRIHVGSKTYLIPGQIWCFVALMEEDETSNGAMESAHQEMRQHIEATLNSTIAAIPVAAVRNAVAPTAPPDPLAWSTRLADAFIGLIDQVTNGFDATLRGKVNQHASDDEDFWNPASWDWDECLGTHVFRMDEVRLRMAARQDLHHDFISTASDGTWDSFYTMTGSVEAQPLGTDVVIQRLGGTSTSLKVGQGTAVVDENKICLAVGTEVSWELRNHEEVEEFLLIAPFTPVTWAIETVSLAPAGGTVPLTKAVRHPKFDFKAPRWVRYETENRAIAITYAFIPADQAIRLRLQNRPADGLYNVDLLVFSAVAPGAPPLATETVTFSGQSIFSPSRDAYDDCLSEKFGWARYKEATLLDLWGPSQRHRIYEEVIREAERRVRAGVLSASRLETLRTTFKQKLRL